MYLGLPVSKNRCTWQPRFPKIDVPGTPGVQKSMYLRPMVSKNRCTWEFRFPKIDVLENPVPQNQCTWHSGLTISVKSMDLLVKNWWKIKNRWSLRARDHWFCHSRWVLRARDHWFSSIWFLLRDHSRPLKIMLNLNIKINDPDGGETIENPSLWYLGIDFDVDPQNENQCPGWKTYGFQWSLRGGDHWKLCWAPTWKSMDLKGMNINSEELFISSGWWRAKKMATELAITNPFLKIAKQLTTPVKKKEEVKGAPDDDLTPPPVSSKKTCTTFEKWIKKQDGDVSLLRDTLIWKQGWCGLIVSWYACCSR